MHPTEEIPILTAGRLKWVEQVVPVFLFKANLAVAVCRESQTYLGWNELRYQLTGKELPPSLSHNERFLFARVI